MLSAEDDGLCVFEDNHANNNMVEGWCVCVISGKARQSLGSISMGSLKSVLTCSLYFCHVFSLCWDVVH